MGVDKHFQERMDALEKRIEKHDEMLRGDSENEGLMSIVRQLATESKQRKKMMAAILIGVVGLLLEQLIRLVGAALDKI